MISKSNTFPVFLNHHTELIIKTITGTLTIALEKPPVSCYINNKITQRKKKYSINEMTEAGRNIGSVFGKSN